MMSNVPFQRQSILNGSLLFDTVISKSIGAASSGSDGPPQNVKVY